MSATRSVVAGLVAVAVVALGACAHAGIPSASPATSASPESAPATTRVVGPLTPADAEALATMNVRLKEYVALHVKLEQSLPTLPTEATPEQIDKNQRAFESLVRASRATAKPGDIFTPEARPVIKRLLATMFHGPQGRQLKAALRGEEPADPVALKLSVNCRYPDAVPLSTVPPQASPDAPAADRGSRVPVRRRLADLARHPRARHCGLRRPRDSEVTEARGHYAHASTAVRRAPVPLRRWPGSATGTAASPPELSAPRPSSRLPYR